MYHSYLFSQSVPNKDRFSSTPKCMLYFLRWQEKFKVFNNNVKYINSTSVGGVMASMVAFQAVDPGSTPGRRIKLFLFLNFLDLKADSLFWTPPSQKSLSFIVLKQYLVMAQYPNEAIGYNTKVFKH